jgi:hypothetical protein
LTGKSEEVFRDQCIFSSPRKHLMHECPVKKFFYSALVVPLKFFAFKKGSGTAPGLMEMPLSLG